MIKASLQNNARALKNLFSVGVEATATSQNSDTYEDLLM